jgi:hypothetical protein
MGIIQKKCSICGKVFTTLDNKSKYCSARAKPMTKQQLEAAGFKEANGIYDTRDWNAIRNWAEELATAVYRTGKSTRARAHSHRGIPPTIFFFGFT